MRYGYLLPILAVGLLLAAGCVQAPPAAERTDAAAGLWLKSTGEPDLLLNLSENGSAELRFVIDLGVTQTIQVRNGSWTPSGEKALNLSYIAPLTNGTRVLSLERDRDELRLLRVWNETTELQGETNLSFRRVVGDPGNRFYIGVENPLGTLLPA